MELKRSRKREISELAEFIAQDSSDECYVRPEVIAADNDILYNLSDYENYFDGMLECDNGSFHIFLNSHNMYDLKTQRLRFSFAHELGHYFIDEHRRTLERGVSLYNPSFYRLAQKNLIEQEADYFAANLLMPSERFNDIISNRKFSYSIIYELTKAFGTSLSATLLRFVEIGNYPICVVYSKDNMIKYIWHSNDFPYNYIKDFYSKKVPLLTVAGDYYNNDIECDDDEIVNASEWFSSYDDLTNIKLHEKCIYQKSQNVVISIIWGD